MIAAAPRHAAACSSRGYPDMERAATEASVAARSSVVQYRAGDSNPHALRRTILSRVRLPVPPARPELKKITETEDYFKLGRGCLK